MAWGRPMPAAVSWPSWWYSSARREYCLGVMSRDIPRRQPGPWARQSGAHLVELRLEVFLALQAHDLIHDLSVLEEEQSGNRVDTELNGEVLVVVDVDLGDLHLAVIFGGQFIQQRPKLLARSAPLGPKIHEHGF